MKKFIDFFSGIGGFRLGLEMAGHECVGHCEIDKFADQSYRAMHDVKENEWYADDITRVGWWELPAAEIWVAGFPCQDISVNGKQLGFKGRRSSLFFAITGLAADLPEKDKPIYLVFENVKNFLSVNNGYDFLKAQVELDKIGYDCEWQVLNTRDFGIPQNRERVFLVGHNRARCSRQVFPIEHNCEQTDMDTGASAREGRKPAREFKIKEATKIGYAIAGHGDSVNLEHPKSKTRRGRVGKQIANTLTTSCNQAIVLFDRLRKLTPLEEFRLQGWPDEYFHRAAAVNSDSQLYKQAGNGVTTTVAYVIGERLE